MSRVMGSDNLATVLNQGLYEVSATQKHRLGTGFKRGNRIFRYCKMVAGTATPGFGVWSYYHQYILYAVLGAASAVGSKYITVNQAATDGFANDGVVAAHDLEGGYVCIFSATTGDVMSFGIKDNAAAASSSVDVVIELDSELPVALTTSDYVEVMNSPYIVAQGNSNDCRPFIGNPMFGALYSAYPYIWVQTRGPAWLTPHSTLGAAQGANHAVWRGDGSVALCTYNDTLFDARHQTAGYVLTYNQTTGQGAPFIFLQCE